MFDDRDVQFHTPENPAFDWAETGYFNFYVPEENLLGFVYIVHRAGVGATVTDVELIRDLSTSPLGSIFVDLCNHNALPERAESFTLPTGLRFEAPSIRQYRIGYEKNGVSFDLTFDAIMEPYDIHDPKMDPLADLDPQRAIANSGFGAAYTEHFDMAVKVEGTLRIGDRAFDVRCFSTMDHSWGPRREDGFHPIVWMNAHFDDGYCLHGIFSYVPDGPRGEQHDFKHGYALEDGTVFGAKAGTIVADRDGIIVQRMVATLTDADGREHRLDGTMLNHHPWQPYGNNHSPLSMIRWERGDGAIGYGTYMEGIPLNHIRNWSAS